MAKNVSRETPLAEIILRKYERPNNLEFRSLVKKICLSIGLLQPGDSRDVIVDILSILITSEKDLTSNEIKEQVENQRKKYSLPMQGIAESNIRRQLKRLKDIFLIDSNQNKYNIAEQEKLIHLFDEKIEKYYLASIKQRVREYFVEVTKQQKGLNKETKKEEQ